MENSKSQLKAGILLNYINLMLGNLVPIFYTPIMLRILGQSEYGLYKLSSSVTSYLGLVSLGIGSAVTRYLIKAQTEQGKDAEEGVFGLFMLIFQVISVVAFIIGVALMLNLQIWYGNSLDAEQLARMRVIVFLLVCNTAISFSASPYVSIVTTHEKFIFLQLMNISTTCVIPIVNLIVLFMGFASIGMACSSLIITLFTRICYVLYVSKNMDIHPRYKNIPVKLIKEILSFSFWIFLATVVGQLYNSTDTVMIGALPALGTVAVAVYNVGGTFNSIVFSLTTGVSSLLAPKTNKMVFSGATNAELTDLAIKIGRIQCYIINLVVTGFIAFGRPFISFYAGVGYEDAYWVAILMMIPNMIPLVQSVCLSVIIAQNKHKFRSIVYLAIAILNVIGTWFMMQTMGIIGAALMTGIALIIGQGFVMNWYYWKKTGLEIFRFWKEIGYIYIIPCIMCVATLLLGRIINLYRIITMLIGIVIYTLIYSVLMWRFTMNSYEKNIFLVPIYKIKNIIHKQRRKKL